MPDKQKKSRQQQYLDAGKEIRMPEVTAVHLLEYLFEIGPTYPGAMGAIVLPISEIASWQQQMGIRLQPWEVRAIRSASNEYANQLAISHDPACPSPLQHVVEANPEKVEKRLRAFFKSR